MKKIADRCIPVTTSTTASLRVAVLLAMGCGLLASAATAGSSRRERAAGTSAYIETELSTWKPSARNNARPSASLLHRQGDPTGTWDVDTGMDGSRLVINRLPDGSLAVTFTTSGCLRGWKLERTGAYRNGVLTLDKPVEEYGDLTYQRLYLVRAAGRNFLVADAAVREFEKGVTRSGKRIKDQFQVEFYAYQPIKAQAAARQ